MVEIRAGNVQDASALAPLILQSASDLLAYLFGSSTHALNYLNFACAQSDGQYSAARHQVATDNQHVIGCISVWHNNMPAVFQKSTVKSLSVVLTAEQISHLIGINSTLSKLFLPPDADELCIGHLAVASQWQGKQVASKLLAYAVRQAKHQGKQRLVLDVDVNNHSAIGFYEKWDFMSQKSQQFSPTKQTFVRMLRDIV